jgi:hypothetical protein
MRRWPSCRLDRIEQQLAAAAVEEIRPELSEKAAQVPLPEIAPDCPPRRPRATEPRRPSLTGTRGLSAANAGPGGSTWSLAERDDSEV